MQHILRVATFNIHKGVTHFNTRFALHHQRNALIQLDADVVFLQEVRDAHAQHAKRFRYWPAHGQTQFLSHSVWPFYAYGQNADYPHGHHGNAILSKFPIQQVVNHDISAHPIEQRGFLHCQITVPHWSQPLHAFCLHLGLLAQWRRKQLLTLVDYIERALPNDDSPMIIAGDFNDWSTRAGHVLTSRLQMLEAFHHVNGTHARSFPAFLPILKLDRIYVRGFDIQHAATHKPSVILNDSDHLILCSTLIKK